MHDRLNGYDWKPTLTDPKIPAKWTQKPHQIIIGIIIKIFGDDILPNNCANNRHNKHCDDKLCRTLKVNHPNHNTRIHIALLCISTARRFFHLFGRFSGWSPLCKKFGSQASRNINSTGNPAAKPEDFRLN